MLPAYIKDRASLADAAELMERYGDEAATKAAALATQSREAGNVVRFCHWRQIQRVIAALSSQRILGSLH